jgi:prephenate dehydrogenase
MLPLLKEMLPAIKRGAIITDVGSVKATVVKELESLVAKAGAHFIGSHPMAGAEKTGVAAARAELFANAVCVVTPTKRSNKSALEKTEAFWKAVGARVLRLAPELHDELVSRSSHLPHVAAATLANLVLDPAHPKSQPMLCATGFRDTTRIASGSPEMWRDIAMANRKNLSKALEVFIRDLKKVQTLLNRGDEKAAEQFFKTGKKRRDAWCASGSTRPDASSSGWIASMTAWSSQWIPARRPVLATLATACGNSTPGPTWSLLRSPAAGLLPLGVIMKIL